MTEEQSCQQQLLQQLGTTVHPGPGAKKHALQATKAIDAFLGISSFLTPVPPCDSTGTGTTTIP